MFVLKQLSLVLVFLIVAFEASAQTTQEYKSIINHATGIMVNDISNIEWGCVDKDFVRLDELPTENNGILTFSIDQTIGIEVGFSHGNDQLVRFGFRFADATNFDLIVNGEIENTYNNGYGSSTFELIKCESVLRYFKDGELLFSHCENGIIPALFQLTTVNIAVLNPQDTELDVIFTNEYPGCPPPSTLVGESPSNEILASSELDESIISKVTLEDAESKVKDSSLKSQPNKIIAVNIHNQGKPIKSYRIRTDANGNIPEGHEVHDYLNKGYQIKIRRN